MSFKSLFTVVVIIGFISAMANTVAANYKPKYISPESLSGAVRVSSDDVIELIGSMDDLVLVDSRTSNDHQMGYIEGSIGMTDIHTNCDNLGKILLSKETPVMFYCNGINCARSDNAVRIARDCGYSHIYWFRGGIEEWREMKFPLVQ